MLLTPFSRPDSYARPFKRPKRGYPGFASLEKSSKILCPWSGRIGILKSTSQKLFNQCPKS